MLIEYYYIIVVFIFSILLLYYYIIIFICIIIWYYYFKNVKTFCTLIYSLLFIMNKVENNSNKVLCSFI